MEDGSILLKIAFLGVLTVSFCYVLFADGMATSTPEYEKGYSLGYSEHNNTKYQASEFVLKDFVHYTDQQRNYASGYYTGYKEYNYDVLINAEARERNETLRVLGV